MRTWAALGDDPVNAPVDTEHLGMHPGQLNVTYIVDVNGKRLIIDTWHMPGTSAADVAELDAILASMRIEPTVQRVEWATARPGTKQQSFDRPAVARRPL